MSWRTWLLVLVVAIVATVWWQQRDRPVVSVAPTATGARTAPLATTDAARSTSSPAAPAASATATTTTPPPPLPSDADRSRSADATATPPGGQGIENPRGAGAQPLLVPVQGIAATDLSDTFSDARSGGRVHDAIDILAPAGTPVLAVADGSVEKLFDSKLGGLTIYQFEPTGRYAYYYAHLQSYAPGLVEKQPITRGQVIGYVGSTGNADPAAPHLHFAVFELGPERQWWRGVAVNPFPLLSASP